MKPERYVWSPLFTMKGPVLVETKSQITAVNIKNKKEHLKLAQVLIVRSKYKEAGWWTLIK